MLPDTGILAKRTIARAGYVAENAVEEELILTFCGNTSFSPRSESRLLGRNFDRGEDGGIKVCNH